MLFDVRFDFCGFLEHRGKFRLLVFVEAVVADAEDAVFVGQQRNDVSEIALPMAAGAGQEQNDRRGFRAERVDLHCLIPSFPGQHAEPALFIFVALNVAEARLFEICF